MPDLKCAICGKTIEGRFWVDGWGNRACVHHTVNMCFACHRIIGRYSTRSKKTGRIGFKVDNERVVCGLCQETCVNSTSVLKQAIDFAIDLLGKAGFKIVREGITDVNVITVEEMQQLAPGAEGLCRATLRSDPKLTTAKIWVLNGMPKIKLESVLAHEMLHYWIFYNGIDGGEQTEGFCNIGEALVLNYYASQSKSLLADHLRDSANNNPDYYYGIKFIEQKKKLQAMGWKNYIKDILETKKITP